MLTQKNIRFLRVVVLLFGSLLLGVALSQIGTPAPLDSSFGNNGTVLLSKLKAPKSPSASVDTQGNIILVGATSGSSSSKTFLTIAKLSSNGQLDNRFGKSGVVQLENIKTPSQVRLDSQNRILIFQNKQMRRYSSLGALDKSYAKRGIFRFPQGAAKTKLSVSQVSVLPDGSFWAALIRGSSKPSQNTDENDLDMVIIKVTNKGKLDTTIGKGGYVAAPIKYPNLVIHFLKNTSQDGVVAVLSGDLNSPAGMSTYEPPMWIVRFDQHGKLEPGQQIDNFESLTCSHGGRPVNFQLRANNSAVFANSNVGDCPDAVSIWSLDAQNKVNSEFGASLPLADENRGGSFSPSHGPAISQGAGGKIWFVQDDTNPPSYSDFTVWHAGNITFKAASRAIVRLLRLTSNGSLDKTFGTDGIQVFDNPFDTSSLSLLETQNGKILLVGLEKGFWSVKQLTL